MAFYCCFGAIFLSVNMAERPIFEKEMFALNKRFFTLNVGFVVQVKLNSTQNHISEKIQFNSINQSIKLSLIFKIY